MTKPAATPSTVDAPAVPLDEQIVAVLTGDWTSEDASAVLAEAQTRLRDMTAQADAADVASLSPLATSVDARALRQQASDLRFEADRLEASCSALDAAIAGLKQAEEKHRRQVAYDAAIVRRDELAADIAAEYPDLVRRLSTLAQRIAENDKTCAHYGIDSAEAVARGLPGSFYRNSVPLKRIGSHPPATMDGIRLAWEYNFDSDGPVYYGLRG